VIAVSEVMPRLVVEAVGEVCSACQLFII